MSDLSQTKSEPHFTGIKLNRQARKFLWPRPAAYFPIGLLRGRGNCLSTDVELYLCGYPRSGNTFAVTAFLSANPEARLQHHRHIPAFVINMAKHGVPGIILLRSPLDAAVSWAIHEEQSLESAVAYYNDYYETLMPYRDRIFVAHFEEVTTDFGGVVRRFNERWGTSYVPFVHTPENAARCFRMTEDVCRKEQGALKETHVSRPSKQRRVMKETMLRDMERSDFLQVELARANALYREFAAEPAARRQSDIISPAEFARLAA
jgi:hypothetical protein